MFEDMTYENILQGMLDQVTNDVDKREGSVIYDALAPAAYFLADQYFRLENYINLFFADTSVGEYLDRCVSDIGMVRNPATFALRKVETSGAIDIGSVWGIEGINYTITKAVSENIYEAVCNTAGEVGNIYSGEMNLISGNTSVTAELTDIITASVAEETDDALRDRNMQEVSLQPASGNAADYLKWAREVSGVGDAKVFPLWAGNGTVKVLIVDAEYSVDESLEDDVYEHIEEMRPIGATVTVDSPTEKSISVSAAIEKTSTSSIEEIKADFTKKLSEYLVTLIADYYKKLDTGTYRVSVGMIGNLLFDTDGVEDYETLTVNGGMTNITINSMEIPVVGTVTISEAEVQNELNDGTST